MLNASHLRIPDDGLFPSTYPANLSLFLDYGESETQKSAASSMTLYPPPRKRQGG
jgi:hypothetical protein